MKKEFIMSTIISITLFFLSLYFALLILSSNVISYVFSVVCATLCFLILFYILCSVSKHNRTKKIYNRLYSVGDSIEILVVCAAIILFTIIYYLLDSNSKNMLGRYIFYKDKIFIIAAFLTILLYLFSHIKRKIQWKYIRGFLECISIVICGVGGYKPNVLYDTYNYTAYWLSVVQVYDRVAYDSSKLSFYGHYPILMLPYFKIVGLNAVTVALLQSIENIVICIAILYCIRKITDSEWIRICGIIAAAYFVGASACHVPQGFPHRVLFIAIMLAIGCKTTYAKQKKNWFVIGYILSFLSIIWNTETGVVLLVAWSFFVFMHSYFSLIGWNRNILCITAIVMIPVIFLCSWGFVSVINQWYLGGAHMTLNEFIYPLLSKDYMAALTYNVEFKFSPWVVVIILLLVVLFFGIKDLILQKGNKETVYFTFVAAMGVMNLVYFFNRAAWGNFRLMAYYQTLLIVLYIMSYIQSMKAHTIDAVLKKGVLWGCNFLFIFMLAAFVINFPQTYTSLKNYQDVKGMNAYFEGLNEKLPMNVYNLSDDSAFFQMEAEKAKRYYENVVNYSAASMQEVRNKLIKAEYPFMVGSRMYITNYLVYWGMITEEELDQLYEEHSIEQNEIEYLVFTPKERKFN